ncbi:MAG: PepSY-associated TM helix domain-containing protein [Bacteroidetes bacterium]|nr:PepSY-associated TM helix domain-containing protein [Bacteroidota bacterium]
MKPAAKPSFQWAGLQSWMWFSDIYAAALIFQALTSFFIVMGKKGVADRGAIYIALGFIIPILFLIFSI